MASSGQAGGGPLLILLPSGIDSYVRDVEIRHKDVNRVAGQFWGGEIPRNPKLEQRHRCRLPPAGGGGWDCFYW